MMVKQKPLSGMIQSGLNLITQAISIHDHDLGLVLTDILQDFGDARGHLPDLIRGDANARKLRYLAYFVLLYCHV